MALVQELDNPRDPGEWLDKPLNDFIGGSEHGRALFSATPLDSGTDWHPNARFVPNKRPAHLSGCSNRTCQCVFFFWLFYTFYAADDLLSFGLRGPRIIKQNK